MEKKSKCKHYKRNCEVEAPCCKIFYPCKLCHDELYKGVKADWCKQERMEFDKVAKIKCTNCDTIQDPSTHCINESCKVEFGKYACLKCKLYENDPKKSDDIFHCDKCAMCRRGTRDKFEHCDKCGYCMAISAIKDHVCREQLVSSDCPVCLENLQFSVKHYFPMKCGHLIHVKCYNSYIRTNNNCPVCGMALQNMSSQHKTIYENLAKEVAQQLPEQLKDKKVSVLCNECLVKTLDIPFNFYVKCGSCGSYNTKQI